MALHARTRERERAPERARMRDLRPYCMGFGLFWAVPLLMVSGAGGINAPSSDWLLFIWTQQAALVGALPVCARLLPHCRSALGGLPFAAGLLLSIAGVLHLHCFALGNSTPVLAVAAGVALGVASSLFYLAWQAIYANEGQARTAIYLPCSAIATALVCLAMLPCPVLVVAMCLSSVLPFAAAYTLWRSARDMVAFEPRPARAHAALVRSDIWKPVACAAAVCFAWGLSSHLPVLYDGTHVFAMLAGLGLGAAAVLALGVRASRSVGLFEVFRALLPLVGIVLVLPFALGWQWTSLTVGIVTFGARIMTLLVLALSAVYASTTQFSTTWVYLRCAYPVFLALFLGDTTGFAITLTGSGAAYTTPRIPALCLAACLAVLMAAILVGKHPRSLAEPADDTLLINPVAGAHGTGEQDDECAQDAEHARDAACEAAGGADGGGETLVMRRALQLGLTAREAEVVELLLKGNTIAALSSKIGISENTTRGHMKRIYRKLDIHSRQELVELVELSDVRSEDEKAVRPAAPAHSTSAHDAAQPPQ